MAMNVRQLIKALQAFPPNAKVVVCSHDQDPEKGEMDGFISTVGEAPIAIEERGAGVVIYQ